MRSLRWLRAVVGVLLIGMAGAALAQTGGPRLLWKAKVGYCDKPTLGDWDGDGRPELLLATMDRSFVVLDVQGKEVARFEAEKGFNACPVVFDVDGDGVLEVAVGNADRNFYLLKPGQAAPLWTLRARRYVNTSAAVVDVGDDGQLELAFGANDGGVYLVKAATGEPIWMRSLPKPVVSSPAVVSLGEGKGIAFALGCDDGLLYLLASDGSPVWSQKVGSRVASSPAVADVNGDGVDDIVAAAEQVVVLSRDGKPMWAFTPPSGRGTSSSPVPVDLTGDGRPEVVVGDYAGSLYALQGNGKLLWTASITKDTPCSSSPAVADVDGDGRPDLLLCTTDGQLLAVGGRDGKTLWRFALNQYSHCCPLVADVNGDGQLEILVTCADGTAYLLSLGRPGKVWWGKFRGDLAGHGVYQESLATGEMLAKGPIRWLAARPTQPPQEVTPEPGLPSELVVAQAPPGEARPAEPAEPSEQGQPAEPALGEPAPSEPGEPVAEPSGAPKPFVVVPVAAGRLALLIGASWEGEQSLHNDVVAMKEALARRGLSPEEILVLEGPLTREGLLQFLRDASQRAAPWQQGSVLLYCAGYGFYTGDTAAEARPGLLLEERKENAPSNGVYWDEILAALELPPDVRLLLLPDCSHTNLLVGQQPPQAAVVVLKAEPGGELTAWTYAQEFEQEGAKRLRGVISYYAALTLPSADTMETWVRTLTERAAADVRLRRLRNDSLPSLEIIGDPTIPLPGQPVTAP